MSRFSRILIANRGEIACRVIRTASALGYYTVAVYTDVDALAPHVQMADAAVRIGAGPVGESYLVAEKILAAAKDSGAEAIHPGYGFLSENAAFARACVDAGLVFIGPGPDAIECMGNKAESKRRMQAAGVPCVPGYEGEHQDDAVLIAEAETIGLPIMVKAAAGGGGRGMRLVQRSEDLAGAIKQARSEAEKAFVSGELILEKAIVKPRHVEIQVFADADGNTVALGERDCSVQRRHQKVIEEAPCPVMSAELRAEMSAAAVAAVRSIGYRGAGTVEFLLDEQGRFYFLEMNTRLQVEHPVTELVTGLDLVALQIQVAHGEPLGLSQGDVELDGHAIEVRLYAEDPAQDFLPTSGPVDLWVPGTGVGIRVDSGIDSGQRISPYYDPLVAKIIAHGPNRDVARMRLLGALNETVLFGVRNNKQFLMACLENAAFIAGEATTAFIADEFGAGAVTQDEPDFDAAAVAAVLDMLAAHRRAMGQAVMVSHELKNWASAGTLVAHRQYAFGQVNYDLAITSLAADGTKDGYRVSAGESTADIELIRIDGHRAQIGINGRQSVASFLSLDAGRLYLMIDGRTAFFQDRIAESNKAEESADGGRLTAPMHGLLLAVNVAAGDHVVKGQSLVLMEAMKMQHELRAAADGKVLEVLAEPGEQVAADDVLIAIAVSAEGQAA